MLNAQLKRFTLPFAPQKDRAPLGLETELASVYALAENERGKGGGLIIKQPKEKLYFIAQVGYPLWLFPSSEKAFIFDGLNSNAYTLRYPDLPTAKEFLESLEGHSKTREEYLAFLFDHQTFFRQPKRENQIQLRGMIVDPEFLKEFTVYRREAVETSNSDLAFLNPALEEASIAATLFTLEKVQLAFREDTDRFPECLRQIGKLTSQYITEIDYAAQAARDEINAKIRAREELINPQITQLNIEYKSNLAKLTRSFDEEIESLKKIKDKTQRAMMSADEKIRQYERQARSQAKRNHRFYEKHWKEKSNKTKKELDALKKEHKRLENRIYDLSKQKNEESLKLSAKLDADIKAVRQPIVDLENLREAKILEFKQQTLRLQNAEKPMVEEIYNAIKQRENLSARFEALGMKDLALKNPALYYVPFYVVCFMAGLSRRYLFVPPSNVRTMRFSMKIKGAFGVSKVKQLFSPRFPLISALIENCQNLVRRDVRFEDELGVLGEKNSFLSNQAALDMIAKGLVYLHHEGWLSNKEYEALSNSLAHV